MSNSVIAYRLLINCLTDAHIVGTFYNQNIALKNNVITIVITVTGICLSQKILINDASGKGVACPQH